MLPTHGRYDYSSITTRPDYSWPGDRRLAVYIALNIEAFGFGVGKGAAIAPPDQAQSHCVYSWRDYGNRVGIWRLFELLDELGLPAEAQLNAAIYDVAPDIPARLRARGDEILGHGLTNSDEQGHLAGGPGARVDRAGHRHDRAARGRPPGGLDEPVALQQPGHHGPAAGGGLPLRDGLDHGRSAGVAPHPQGPHPRDAVPDRGQRHARDHLVPLHRGRVRGHDRGPVRRDAGAVGGPAAGVPDLAAPLRHRPALPHPAAAPGAPAHPRARRSRLARRARATSARTSSRCPPGSCPARRCRDAPDHLPPRAARHRRGRRARPGAPRGRPVSREAPGPRRREPAQRHPGRPSLAARADHRGPLARRAPRRAEGGGGRGPAGRARCGPPLDGRPGAHARRRRDDAGREAGRRAPIPGSCSIGARGPSMSRRARAGGR